MTDKTESDKLADLTSKLTKALESIERLEAKNKELAAEKQAAKTQAESDREAREAAEEEKARKDNDLNALEARLIAKHERELAKLTKVNTEYESRLNTLLIDNAINQAMTEHNILPQFRKAVTAMIKSEAKLADGEAVAGNMALGDYIAEFVSSDDGKVFVAADANKGAAVTNQTTNINAALMTSKPVTADEINKFMALASENPALANELADKWGAPEFKVG